MKPELLLTRAIYEPTMAALEREFSVHRYTTDCDRAAFLRAHGANIRAVVTPTTAGLSRAEFALLPRLEIVACYGPYTQHIDLGAATERGIVVTATPDSTAEPVADLAIGLLIAVMRRLCGADRFVRAGQWPTRVFPSGREVHHKTCGIVGLGRIGLAIAQRAASFDMSICYHGPRAKDGVPYRYYADLQAMARDCDCLVIACALTQATHGLVDEKILRALGAQGYLINIARGKIVDEPALVAALANGTIAGAGLDVFSDEPHVPAALLAMDNVVLAPHMGTSTHEIRAGRSEKLLADLRAYFAGARVRYAVPL